MCDDCCWREGSTVDFYDNLMKTVNREGAHGESAKFKVIEILNHAVL